MRLLPPCLRKLHEEWKAKKLHDSLVRPSQHIPFETEFIVDGKKITYETVLRRYARLVLKVGINLQPGGNIIMTGPMEHFFSQSGEKSYAAIFAEEAYAMGAKYIYMMPADAQSSLYRIEKSDTENLSYLPAFYKTLYDEIAKGGEAWSRVAVGPAPEMPAARGMDAAEEAARRALVSSAAEIAEEAYTEKVMSKLMPWNVTIVPTFEYAQRFMADSGDPPLVKLYRTWETYIKVIGLHHDDPVAFWQKVNDTCKGRSAKLNELKPRKLHFTSKKSGTNLEVELVQDAGWTASSEAKTPEGNSFMANIPSFEVYTSPHRMQVNGILRTTKPVIVDGKKVEGLWLEFKDGVVTKFGADKNVEVFQAKFDKDENFRRAGEIALVGKDSPINQLGRLFLTTLFDENATIHLALGKAYPLKLAKLDKGARVAAGLNDSKYHVDLMFGADDMSVVAYTDAGHTAILMQNGSFTNFFDDPIP